MSTASAAGAAAVLTLLFAAACGGPTAGEAPAVSPSAAGSTAPTAAQPPPTPTPRRSPAPTTSVTPAQTPDRRRDQAVLERALVTAADLGRPWVAVEGDPPTEAPAAACPGRPSAVSRLPSVAGASRSLTEGPGELINGATFRVATLRDTDGSHVRSAWQADTKACRAHTDASDFYVVHRLEGPTSAPNADEILLSRAERIFFDRGDSEPAYARHTVVARTGRVVTAVSYTFLIEDSDAEASNFARARKLLDVQLAKVAAAFAE